MKLPSNLKYQILDFLTQHVHPKTEPPTGDSAFSFIIIFLLVLVD